MKKRRFERKIERMKKPFESDDDLKIMKMMLKIKINKVVTTMKVRVKVRVMMKRRGIR